MKLLTITWASVVSVDEGESKRFVSIDPAVLLSYEAGADRGTLDLSPMSISGFSARRQGAPEMQRMLAELNLQRSRAHTDD